MRIIKRILYILSLLTVYEVSKYVTNKYIVREQNDVIDKYPKDYEVSE
ncbi:transcriptional activator RinB [Staphylococcus arlettae]